MTTFTPGHAASPHHRVVLAGTLIAVLLSLAAIALVVRDTTNDGVATSSLVGSGTAAIGNRDVAPFTAVRLDGANSVLVHVGGHRSVVVRADDNLIRHVTTAVRGGTLVIGSDRAFDAKTPMSVVVTVPALESATLLGAGQMTVDGVTGASFTASLPGSGTVSVSGTTGRLDARLAGSGELRLADLVARHATAAITGTGQLTVHATRSLDASVTGTGEIVYRGNPVHVSTQVTGTGVVTPG